MLDLIFGARRPNICADIAMQHASAICGFIPAALLLTRVVIADRHQSYHGPWLQGWQAIRRQARRLLACLTTRPCCRTKNTWSSKPRLRTTFSWRRRLRFPHVCPTVHVHREGWSSKGDASQKWEIMAAIAACDLKATGGNCSKVSCQ